MPEELTACSLFDCTLNSQMESSQYIDKHGLGELKIGLCEIKHVTLKGFSFRNAFSFNYGANSQVVLLFLEFLLYLCHLGFC